MILPLLLLALDPVVEDASQMLGELIPMATVSATEDAETSPHFLAMRKWFEALAAREGFALRTFGDNAVFELSWGEGDPQLALIVHGDVVPAPREEWTLDPFVLTRKDGKLYGRGTEDDKGALAAALAVMKAKKAAGFVPHGKVLLIVGMGEEHAFEPMRAYVAALPKTPVHCVSLDSGFPVTANEFGFVAWTLAFSAGPSRGTLAISELRGGEFLTQVPGTASLVVRGREAGQEVARAIASVKRPEMVLRSELKGEDARVAVNGTAVHASEVETGKNALWGLSALAAKLPLKASSEATALQALARFFDGDHYGKKLGLAYADKDMGKLIVVPTVLRQAGARTTLAINMRRPRGKSTVEFATALEGARARMQKALRGKVEVIGDTYIGEPHVAQVSATVPVLLDIYARIKHVEAPTPLTIRGGTYARLFPGGVNFGPSFPDAPYMGHAPDEYLSEAALGMIVKMLGEVVERLAR